MTKQRMRAWLRESSGKGENAVHDSILKDRKALSHRLSKEELGLLIDTFDATETEDLYGSLSEYLSAIQAHIADLIALKKRLAEIRQLSCI